MEESLCVFEDHLSHQLLPLAYTRPVYDFRCGIHTLREKLERSYPRKKLQLFCRDYLAPSVKRASPGVPVNSLPAGSSLFVNGRILADEDLARRIPFKGDDALFVSGSVVVAIRLRDAGSIRVGDISPDMFRAELFPQLPRVEVDLRMINYCWDLIDENGTQIAIDFRHLTKKKAKKLRGKVYPGVHLLNRKDIVVQTGAVVKPGVVLDAESGPIYIDKYARVFPNAVIEGPAYVGPHSLIKIGAKIYEKTSIGEMCKVGGEVEASIIHSFSNKQHEGFLGHSYLGMWCNLGADTNNSDLKNNYGTVKVHVNGELVDSGSQFVGLIMGDHSKSGINTMFNTGTVVGVSSNVFGSGYPAKFVPSFAWGGQEGLEAYHIEKALDVARRVMARRKVEFSMLDEELLREVFERTKEERSFIH